MAGQGWTIVDGVNTIRPKLSVNATGSADWAIDVKADDLTGIQVLSPTGTTATALHMGPGALVYAFSDGHADYYANYRKAVTLNGVVTSTSPAITVNGPGSIGNLQVGLSAYISLLLQSAQNGDSVANILNDLGYNVAFQMSEQKPIAPTAALVVDGTGVATAGSHVFAVGMKTATGESLTSVASNAVTVDGTHTKVTLTIPVGSAFVTARNIYASKAGTVTPLFLVSSNTVNDNTTTTYTFNTADASLTATTSVTAATSFDTRASVNYAGGMRMAPVPFAKLPATPSTGMYAAISDSNTVVWGAAIAGGGANNVLGFYNGTSWTVAGK